MADQTTKIPKGWKITTLGEVADVQNGYAFRSEEFSKSGTPIIKIKNIASGKITLDDLDYYEKDIKNLKTFQIKKGDILVSMTGSHISQISSAVGKVAKYNLETVSLLNQRVGKIYPKENLSDNKYLWYLVVQPEVQFFWGNKAGGSANQANISPSIIKSYQFILPFLPEQCAIAAVLSSLDDKIELLREQNKTLEATAQVIFKEWFVNFNFPGATGKMINSELGEIPDGWRVGKIKDLIDILSGFAFSSLDFLQDGEYKLVTIKNVQDRYFDPETKDRLSSLPAKMPDYCRLEAGDILLSLTGNVGRICLVNGDKFLLNQRVAKLKEKNPIDYAFTYLLFLQDSIFSLLQSTTSGTAQQNLSPIQTREIEILIADRKTLDQFGIIANKLIQKINDNNSQIQTLSALRDTLLPKLMRGEVRVNGFKE